MELPITSVHKLCGRCSATRKPSTNTIFSSPNIPHTANWVDAWQDKAFLQWSALDDYAGASKTLLDFVDQSHDSPFAADNSDGCGPHHGARRSS